MANQKFTEVRVFIDENGNRVEIPIEKESKFRKFTEKAKEKTNDVVKTIVANPFASVIIFSVLTTCACRIINTRNASKNAQANLIDARRRQEEYYDRKRRREEEEDEHVH